MTSFTMQFLLATALGTFPPFAFSQSQSAAGEIRVVVKPEARMTIEAIESPASDTSGARWLRMAILVRLNPDTTAALFAELASVPEDVSFIVKDAGEGSSRTVRREEPLFTTGKNGRHVVLVGILAKEREPSSRFVLSSSDGAFSIRGMASH